MSGRSSGALAGLFVLDLSVVLAGPTVGRIFADLGARVVKVERPEPGDPVRSMGRTVGGGDGAWWAFVGRNKETVSLDLEDPAERTHLMRMVGRADVLVESFRPGTMARWGLDYEALAAINSRLVVLRISGFGVGGPREGWLGFGTLAEALSGFAALNGDADRPRLPPTGLADSVAGLQGTVAVLAALYERQRSGRGQLVEVNLYEPLLGVLGGHVVRDASREEDPGASARGHVRGLFATADGDWIAVSAHSAATGGAIARLLGVAGGEGLDRGAVHDPDEVHRRMVAWIGGRSRDNVLTHLLAAGIPAVPVLTPGQLSHDPQVMARGSLAAVAHGADAVRMPGIAMDFSRSEHAVRHIGRPQDDDRERVLAEFAPDHSLEVPG
ncbi:CaiB/BaiF CoA transferase family protein [Parafrankia sp. FMc2]|uniref:CaiB/BaiF CoA transferase family protein n=1 Tax=Parafrankia sp. FMc2 TaxID=3233196 RepID=UPI0034D6B0BD